MSDKDDINSGDIDMTSLLRLLNDDDGDNDDYVDGLWWVLLVAAVMMRMADDVRS